jgi:hypothetical protein
LVSVAPGAEQSSDLFHCSSTGSSTLTGRCIIAFSRSWEFPACRDRFRVVLRLAGWRLK